MFALTCTNTPQERPDRIARASGKACLAKGNTFDAWGSHEEESFQEGYATKACQLLLDSKLSLQRRQHHNYDISSSRNVTVCQ